MEKSIDKNCIHNGHRERMRASISQKNSFDGMPDHEVLEYLLSMAIPRKDTNPLAHELINYFGSFSAVLDADVKDLVKIKGIGERSALFISSLKFVLKRYKESKSSNIKTLSTPREVREFIGEKIRYLPNEECYAIFLNSSNNIICSKKIGLSDSNKVMFQSKSILENALAVKAAGVILAHNHPGDDPSPSREDIESTRDLYINLSYNEIVLLDHYIYTQNSEYSFRSSGKIEQFEQLVIKWKRMSN